MSDKKRRLESGEPARAFARESKILSLILKFGLDFEAISRRSGIPVETVRYLYKERILKKRLRVERTVVRERLGLSHIQFIVEPEPRLEPLLYNRKTLSSLWEDVYISSAYRMIPETLFFLDHLAPTDLHSKLTDFYRRLEEMGALKVRGAYRCAHPVHPRMRIEEFDWELPGWDFDWSPATVRPAPVIDTESYARVRFDRDDLSILKAVQYNYDQPITEIAAKNHLNQNSASWHFRKHVLERGLLGEYRINWLGTARPDREMNSGVSPQTHQSFAATSFIARDLSPAEMMGVRARIRAIPYLWSERVGEADYYAEALIPLRSIVDALGFFSEILRPLEGRARIFMTDQAGSVNFTLYPHLFDEESGEWMYKGDYVIEEVRKALSGSAPSPRRKSARARGR